MSSIESRSELDAVCDTGQAVQLVGVLLNQTAHQAAMRRSRVMSASDAEPDDAVLISAVLSGDIERFAPLVTRYQPRVMRFIRQYEHNVQDAQDLAQETFFQAFRALPSFNGRSRFSTWLTGIAFNLLKNHISRSPTKQHVHLDMDDQPDGVIEFSSGNPAQAYESSELLRAMERAVAALPHQMRDAVVLVVSEGLSYEEAAEALEVPVGTLKSRLCRARQKLVDTLRDYRIS